MPSSQIEPPRVKFCNRPGCEVIIKPGQLACRDHWFELPKSLRDRLVDAWELRKEHPDVPELVDAHRALLVEALRAWKVPVDIAAAAMRQAPRAIKSACPWCGAPPPFHRPGCRFYPENPFKH